MESISSFTLTPANGARKKKTAIDRYGRANRPDHSKKWDQSLWAYRWWGRSLSHTRHQPRWADDEDRRFEVGQKLARFRQDGLNRSAAWRCLLQRDVRSVFVIVGDVFLEIFGLEAGWRKVETLLASLPERYPPDNVEPILMTYSIYCMGQDWLGKLA